MRHHSERTTTSLLATGLVIGLLAMLVPNEGHAWEFETCSSKIVSEVDTSEPQAMIMLDRSGSMAFRPGMSTRDERKRLENGIDVWEGQWIGWLSYVDDWYGYHSYEWTDPKSGMTATGAVREAPFVNQPDPSAVRPSLGVETSNGYWFRYHWTDPPQDTLWSIAIESIEQAIAGYDGVNGPKMNFGIGTFARWVTPQVYYSNYVDWADILGEAHEYSDAASLMSIFEHSQRGPYGGTPTDRAIELMANSTTVSDQNKATAGILVTDGYPTLSETGDHRVDAVQQACAHRYVARLYVIGFSSGTDKDFNDLLAAAGGTGTCWEGDPTNPADPCAMSPSAAMSDLTCNGSFHADTGSELQDALDTIANEIACTYPLDILGTPDGQAPDDPAGTRVYLGECTPGPGAHNFGGDEFDPDPNKSDGTTTTSAPLGIVCSDICGATYSQGDRLTYDMPTTPGETNTVRIRLADYLHDCQDALEIEVYADNQLIGTWTGSGINDWETVEFDFVPTLSDTFITIHQANDACCGCSGSCQNTCGDHATDLNLYVDWIKMLDPQAGCASGGTLSYVPSGSSGNGWTFTQNRTHVELVGQACSQVQARQHDEVTTQVACPCEQTTGGTCKADPGARCPTGKWQCTSTWQDVCVPDNDCDDDCAPRTSHNLELSTPKLQMVVDNSGSMWSSDSGISGSKHVNARDVIADVADWSYQGAGCDAGVGNCDRVEMGVHFWSTSKTTVQAVKEDMTGDQIEDIFNSNWPGGGTHFDLAAELLRDENALTDPTSPNFGLMVTDGAPCCGSYSWTSLRDNLEITCDLRSRPTAPIGTYVLGFGSGNNVKVNSLVAAAGGTGICCEGAGCTITCDADGSNCTSDDPNAELDPCSLKGGGGPNGSMGDLARAVRYNNSSYYNGVPVSCEGNIPATNAAELKSRMQNLIGNLECAYPLELLPGMTSAPEDPSNTYVDIFLTNAAGFVDVPHVDNAAGQQQFVDQLNAKGVSNASTYSDQGWRFGNQGRTYVEFTDKLCDLVNSGEVENVETQVCEAKCQLEGDSCIAPCDGTEPYCDGDGNKVGRCREGVYECIDDQDVCVSLRSPMPEICNGLDDSCDGQIDNLSDNISEWSEPEYDISTRYGGQYDGWYCGNRNVCSCPDGEPDSMGGTANDADEFREMLDNQEQNGACRCGEGLGYTPGGAAYQPTSPSPEQSDPGAACSSTGQPGQTAPWAVLVFGSLVLAVRLRRRRQG